MSESNLLTYVDDFGLTWAEPGEVQVIVPWRSVLLLSRQGHRLTVYYTTGFAPTTMGADSEQIRVAWAEFREHARKTGGV